MFADLGRACTVTRQSCDPGKCYALACRPIGNETVFNPFRSNSAALYASQIFQLGLPVILIPFLAPRLGINGWGFLAIAQSGIAIGSLISEYGFSVSAVREVSQKSTGGITRERLESLASFRVISSFAGAIVASAIIFSSPLTSGRLTEIILAAIAALTAGSSLTWYLHGTLKFALISWTDVFARILSTIAVIALVCGPADIWIILTSIIFVNACITVVSYWAIPADLRPRHFRWTLAPGREFRSSFALTSVNSLYSLANPIILGFAAGAAEVGAFSAAEKLMKAARALLKPVSQLVFPQINMLMATDREQARRIAIRSLIFMIIAGVIASVGLTVFSPIIIPWLYGDEYISAISCLNILAWVIPLSAASNILGMQWLVPNYKDSHYLATLLVFGALNVAAGIAASGAYLSNGMSTCVLGIEALITASLFIASYRSLFCGYSKP